MALFDKFRRGTRASVTDSSNDPHIRYPDGKRLYCIGDIHGRADLLEQLHKMIEADASGYDGDKQLLYLGYYIDRGEESKRVVDILLDEPLPDFEAIYLLGNH